MPKHSFDFDLRDHGVAARHGAAMSLLPVRHPRTGRDRVYVGLNTGGPFLIVEVDVATGRCRQFLAEPDCQAPWGMIATPDGRVLITSSGGQLSLLDPAARTLRVVARAKAWLWSITLGTDGRYYLAGNAPNQLHRFDLATGRLENLGSMSPTQTYFRVVVAGADGYIYGTTGTTRPQVIAYHIATGRITELLPKREETFVPFHALGRGPDGSVCAVSRSGHAYRLENGRAHRIAPARWKGLEPTRLPDGRVVRCVEPDAICLGEGRQAQYFPLRCHPPGSGIFHLASGPRGAVYGSSILPLYLFRYRPGAHRPECLGRGAPDNGEAYSFGHVDGKLYYATYPSAHLLRYDPAQPWQATPAAGRARQPSSRRSMGKLRWDRNPKLLGKFGTGHCRPRAMFVDARKRVWVGSFPEYGKSNGGLAYYDTVKKSFQNNPVVLPNYSIVALTANDAGTVVYGGTDILLGSGTPSVETEARLFAWDVANRRLQWDCVPVAGATGILNLVQLNGKLYGTTHQSHFFVYDIASRTVENLRVGKFAPARQQSLAIAPDGNLYGITWMSLFRWRPNGELNELWRVKGRPARPFGGSLFHVGAAISGGRLYFSNRADVMSVRLPLETGPAARRRSGRGAR